MPLQATSGAASYDAFGGGVPAVPNYIEDVFSTYLYTGNGSIQTITNGIDLAGKGGMIWQKDRTDSLNYHMIRDTLRGIQNTLSTNVITAQSNQVSDTSSSFNSNGFTTQTCSFNVNLSGDRDVSWTFRKQPKFFDVVTYTGTGANRTIAHALDSVPGCIIVKRTDTTGAWQVYHRSLANTQYMVLNSTAAVATGATRWNSTTPTSSVFSVGTDATVNASGGTYVAYLVAHNAGGFGLTGTDNVISCGSFASIGSALSVNLGYEPQWLLFMSSSNAGNWELIDNMRGFQVDRSGATVELKANTSAAEAAYGIVGPTSTGFTFDNGGSGVTYIYVAIRRGPMKVPTVGTQVYNAIARTGTGAAATVTGVGFAPDLLMSHQRDSSFLFGNGVFDRLRGSSQELLSYLTNAETSETTSVLSLNMDGASYGIDNSGRVNWSASTYAQWFFRRAPGFFDEVCYTGSASAITQAHNLTVVPELIIVKSRSSRLFNWAVYAASQGATKRGLLNMSNTFAVNSTMWNDTAPTASVFTVGVGDDTNPSAGSTMVAYLFATCAGVSKVGSYTGNGTTQTINCGFTGGARFVLIKRTDAIGDWYVYDTARGMTVGTDPYLLLNSTDAESATLGSVTTVSTGFAVNASILAAINTNAATYIFLAIA